MKQINRVGIYILGMFLLVVGISLNAKTGLGVSLTTLIGLLSVQKIIGISIGTLVAMLVIGRVVFMTNRLFRARMRAAAGLLEERV